MSHLSTKLVATFLLLIFAQVWLAQPLMQGSQTGGVHVGCDCGCDENSVSCCCSPVSADDGVSIRACGTGFPSFTVANFSNCLTQPYFELKQLFISPLLFQSAVDLLRSPDVFPAIEHPPQSNSHS